MGDKRILVHLRDHENGGCYFDAWWRSTGGGGRGSHGTKRRKKYWLCISVGGFLMLKEKIPKKREGKRSRGTEMSLKL